ncbi:MAG: hypothetical protein E6J41_15575 [Chloroflexi bacterium]|nr:MAG: hypothetical protein E6J41_15575 [Chloroflexota bacterium]
MAVVGEEPRDGVRLPLGADLGAALGNGDVRLDPLEQAAEQLRPLGTVNRELILAVRVVNPHPLAVRSLAL